MVTVVPARYEHLPALRILFARLLAERGTETYPIIDAEELDRFVLMLAARIEGQDPYGACLVAEADGHLLGFIAMQLAMRAVGKPRQFGFVDFLGVVEGARHHGIGRLLLDALFDWFAARGISHFEAHITPGLGPDWLAYGGEAYAQRAWITVDTARRTFLVPGAHPVAPLPPEGASITPPPIAAAPPVVTRRRRRRLTKRVGKSRPNGSVNGVTP